MRSHSFVKINLDLSVQSDRYDPGFSHKWALESSVRVAKCDDLQSTRAGIFSLSAQIPDLECADWYLTFNIP